MKHSTVKVVAADTVMQVADLDSLDFMVIIEGSLTLRVEGKPERTLMPQDYVYPAPGRVKEIKVGASQCVAMSVQRMQFKKIVTSEVRLIDSDSE
jgi:glyoxylate utilization-related uncharacterized protein